MMRASLEQRIEWMDQRSSHAQCSSQLLELAYEAIEYPRHWSCVLSYNIAVIGLLASAVQRMTPTPAFTFSSRPNYEWTIDTWNLMTSPNTKCGA